MRCRRRGLPLWLASVAGAQLLASGAGVGKGLPPWLNSVASAASCLGGLPTWLASVVPWGPFPAPRVSLLACLNLCALCYCADSRYCSYDAASGHAPRAPPSGCGARDVADDVFASRVPQHGARLDTVSHGAVCGRHPFRSQSHLTYATHAVPSRFAARGLQWTVYPRHRRARARD